jgi:hypothetical protein
LEATDDEMSFQEWKAWKKKNKLQRKKEKFSTKIIIESNDDADTDYRKRSSSSSKVKKRANYRQVGHNYTFQISSEHNASIHMGKPPHFCRNQRAVGGTVSPYLGSMHRLGVNSMIRESPPHGVTYIRETTGGSVRTPLQGNPILTILSIGVLDQYISLLLHIYNQWKLI